MSLAVPGKPRKSDVAAAAIVVAVAVVACLLLALAIGVSAGNCSIWFAIPGLCDSPLVALPAAVIVAALPALAFALAGRPLAALLGLYIVLVPIDDALLVGGGFTVTKMVGFAIAIFAGATMLRRGMRVRVPYAVFGWLALIALMALSLTWSIDPEMSTGNLATIVSEFALLLILVAVPMKEAELRTVVWATILSGAAVGIIAMALARHELSTQAGQVGRLYLSFGTATVDPNRFGAALLLPIAMTVGTMGQTKRWTRAALLVPLGLALGAVYLSASRGTLVAIGAMAAVAILYSRRRVLLGSILAVVAALVYVVPSELSSRLNEGTGSTLTGRTDIWRVAVAAFPQHWLLGSGVGTFIAAYNRAFFLTYQPQFLDWDRDPHNLIMSTAVELGAAGIVLLAGALILQYRSVRLIPPPFAWLRPVFAAALIGLIVAAMFVDVLATKFAWLLFTEMLIFAGFGARTWLLPRSRLGRTPDP
ncbi:MAG TPA: O-antigen ligase family protein [Candidatus Cybelea sp.]|nr:O-antigen ligase family protein [Candidatus Cybelea sp.]